MDEYCKNKGLQRKNVRFVFNGRKVFETDTPKLIGMKEGDNIDAYERLQLFT